MRRWFGSLAVLLLPLGLLALAACAAKEEAKPAPVAPAPAAPAAKPAWEAEWEGRVAAAKREGAVAVMAPAGEEARRALQGFEHKYGIKVEYLGGRGPEFTEKIRVERAAGQYLWDISMGGITHWIPFLEEGVFDPVEPAFLLPELKDPKTWRLGKPFWDDAQRRVLGMGMSTSNPLFINPNLVKPGEIKSFRDLLEPKWKGKLITDDPRIAGASQSQYTMFYLHPALGPDYIRALARQDLAISRDRRQELEWLAAGRFPVLIGGSRSTAVPLVKQGLPIENVDPGTLREGGSVAVGNSHLLLFNKAPHPNAAKLFINWILTKEGAYSFLKSQGIPSLRVDVAADYVEPWELPREGYIRVDGLEVFKVRGEVAKLTEEVFAGR